MRIRLAALLFVALSVVSGCAMNKTYYTADRRTVFTVTENPVDPTGSVSIFRVKIHALIGIPYGHQGKPVFFTSLAACENARKNMTFAPAGLAAAWETPEVPLSTPCEPVHYQKEDLPPRETYSNPGAPTR